MSISSYNRIAKNLIRLAPSLLTFIFGVGALFIADILISRYGATDTIAAWATLRSFMMVGGVCAMFGMGQLLVREPTAVRLITKLFVMHAAIIALIGGVIGVYFGFVDRLWVGVVVIFGVAISNTAFQWLRSNLALTKSYIANGAWRVIFMLLVIFFFIGGDVDITLLLAVAFLISSGIIGYLLMATPVLDNLKALHSDIKRPRDVYIVGATYFMSGLSLAIASYGENLVVHQMGTTQDLATYFRASVVFLFPGVVLNQYLAAIIGPMIRQNESRIVKAIKKYGFFFVGGLLLLWPLLIVGGMILEFLIYQENSTPLSLIALLTLTSCVRISYVIPSSFVGVAANKKQLQITTILYLLCAFLFPVLAVIFAHFGVIIILSVALANLINWVLRCCVGANIVVQRIKYYQSDSIT